MIRSANYYEYVNCPIRPSGDYLSPYSNRNRVFLEEWIWLEEAVRTAEIRASAAATFKSTSYTKSYPQRIDVARVLPDRRTLEQLKSRMNALLGRQVIKGYTVYGVYSQQTGYSVFPAPSLPSVTQAELDKTSKWAT